MALPQLSFPQKVEAPATADGSSQQPAEKFDGASSRQALVSKAYANALKSFLTSMEIDLASTDQALFIADSRGIGIPSPLVHEAYVNSQVFVVADVLQRGNSPVFRHNGQSYFDTLSSYVSHVELHPEGKPSADARRAYESYIKAKHDAEEEFGKAINLYKQAKASDPGSVPPLNEWLHGEYGKAFRDAHSEESKWSTVLKHLQDPEMSAVVKVRDILDSAESRMVYKLGATMPVTLKNRTVDVNEKPAQAEIIYRPSYTLSNFDTIVREWVTNSKSQTAQTRSIPLDLDKAKDTTWSDLGFPWLDDATILVPDRAAGGPQNDTDDSTELQGDGKVQSEITLDNSITEQPAIDLNVVDLKDVSIKLVVTGIQTFDVVRGLWDIQGFRETLPPLLKNAPKYLSTRFFKTTKVLLAYDVDVIVELPESVRLKLAKGNKVDIKSDVLGALPVTVDADGMLHTQIQRNNGYASVLAVLAELV